MKSTPPEERQDQIIRLLRQGEERGMRLLFEHYGAALLALIDPIIPQREIAEEVLHDVLVKIWRNFGAYDETKSRLFTWMARIAKNAAIDRVRSKKYRQRYKTDTIDDVVARRVELSVETPTDALGIRKLLRHLDANHRIIIELLYLNEYTQSEVAQTLDVPLGTVKTRARRALLQLREVLKHEMAWWPLLYFSTLNLFGL